MNEQILEQAWDVIVIGTGMGGATVGYALAKAGKRVLFLERGKSTTTHPAAIQGTYPEESRASSLVPLSKTSSREDLLSRAGREWMEISDESRPRKRTIAPFVGAGTGGSSALYGMVLERFFPSDFSPQSIHAGATDSELPESWPVSYGEMVPFYEAAERLYRVRGEWDGLRGEEPRARYLPAPALSEGARQLKDHLVRQGCHPYRVPQACEFKPGCASCQGYLCAQSCKNDSARICLEPAVMSHGAHLLDECEVLRLEADPARVTRVLCRRAGRTFALTGDKVILAAGALNTPRILLSSKSEEWPNGLANRSGLVGRCLMRHFTDLYVLKLGSAAGIDVRAKEIAFNDFYHGAHRLGTVQSFGALPPAEQLVEAIQEDLSGATIPFAAPLFGLAKPAVTWYLRRVLRRGPIIASIMEDLPYRDNRVEVDEAHGGLRLHYRVHGYDQERISRMRQHLKKLLHPFAPMLLKQAENNDRLAHACGTCRFGQEPTRSVLNGSNRAHDIENLYVVDSSFFPSSGGINPALTIAANALRVADRIATGNA